MCGEEPLGFIHKFRELVLATSKSFQDLQTIIDALLRVGLRLADLDEFSCLLGKLGDGCHARIGDVLRFAFPEGSAQFKIQGKVRNTRYCNSLYIPDERFPDIWPRPPP